MAKKTRLGLDGYGVRRAGSFAGRAAATTAVGSASGTGTAAATGKAFFDAIGAGAGTSSATATGLATTNAIGSASGTSTAAAISAVALGPVYLDPAQLGPTIVLSNANLTATQTAAATGNTRATAHHSAGDYYHEFTVNVAGDMKVGLCSQALPLTQYLGEDPAVSIGVDDSGGWIGAGGTTTAPALIVGHSYGMATHIDGAGGGAAWLKDITAAGYWNADASANPVTGVNGATFFVDVDLVPAQAAAVGYNVQTFKSTFTSSEYDVTNSKAFGFKWYSWNYFGGSTNLSAIVLNGDGSVTLTGDPSGPNGEISTACDKGSGTFAGTAFGGGAYFEATLKFDPAQVVSIGFAGFPSWWSMAIEHMVGMANDHWPGQASNYTHFAEVDFMEYGVSARVPSVSDDFILCSYHDWYGVSPQSQFTHTGLQGYVATPPSTFTDYHKYGGLWVPATSSTRGYIKFYFDDVWIGNIYSWYQNTGQPPPGTAVFTATVVNEDYGWQYNNIRQVLAPALLGASSGSKIRVTFQTAAESASTFDSVWVGHSAAAGNESNYDGNQVQLTFDNGSASKALNLGSLAYPNAYDQITTDWVPFTYDNTKKLVVGFHVSGPTVAVNINFSQQTSLTGATLYTAVAIHGSQFDPRTDNSGVTTPNLPVSTATTCLVLKVEVQNYTPLSILDNQHLALMLGTYAGAPMTVQSVKVWQASGANNWPPDTSWTEINGLQPTIAADFTKGKYYGMTFADLATARTTDNNTIDSAGNTVAFSNNQVRISDLGVRYTTNDSMTIGGALATALLSASGTLLLEVGHSELVEGVYDITTGPNYAAFIGSAGVTTLFIGRGGNGTIGQSLSDVAFFSGVSNPPGNGTNLDSDSQAIALSWDQAGPTQSISNGGGTIVTRAEAFTRSAPVYIGRRSDGGAGDGLIRSIRYFPTAYTGATLQALAYWFPSLLKLVAYGDSLAAGAGASVGTNRWLELLGTAHNPDADVGEMGAGGTTSSQMLTTFNADAVPEHRTWINLFWTGHNDSNAALTVSNIQACVAQLTGEKKYLVLLQVRNDADTAGDIITTRNACLAAFPNRCVDVPAALAAANNGSGGDLADVAAGYTPSSLQADAIHLNDQGQIVVRNAVADKLYALGWSTYVAPPYTPIP